jgi:hypothetical protein
MARAFPQTALGAGADWVLVERDGNILVDGGGGQRRPRLTRRR